MTLRFAILACLVLCAGVAHAGEVGTDAKRGITMRVPDGYKSFAEGMAQPNTILSYAVGEPGEPGFVLIGVTALGGTIGRESFDTAPIVKQIAAATGMTLVQSARRPLAWKGFELDGFVATMRMDEQTVTFAGVQIPVRAEAVQITMMRLGDKELGAELQAVLAGFEAESNWLSTEERVSKLVVGLLTFGATVGLGTFFWIRRRRQRAAR